MRISVLIPTYCRVLDLTRCLEALYAQTIKPHEVIVIVRANDTETLQFIEGLTTSNVFIKTARIEVAGVVQAMNKGLLEVTGDVVAITDDDSAPFPEWLEQINRIFEHDKRVGGVGGRDWIHQDGLILDGKAATVGKIQWFGRMIGNHHLGAGAAREVDFLKGVNCAYLADPLKKLGFDNRLLGTGAQVHWELSVGLSLKKQGWKLIYDPSIGVGHYPSQRFDEDKRNEFNPIALRNATHNETLVLLEHLSSMKRIFFLLWAFLMGSASSPGLLQWIRNLVKRREKLGSRYHAALTGRYMGIRSWKKYRTNRRKSEGTKVGIVMPLADLRGGAELMLLHLLRANKQLANIDYTLVFLEKGPLVQEVEALGYPVSIYQARKLRQLGRYVSTVFTLYRWMRRENIDIVMSWMSKAHLYAGPAAWLARVDAVWFQHGVPELDLMEKCLKYIPATAVLCPSNAAKESQLKNNPKLPAFVIYPGVDLEEYNPLLFPPAEEVRKKLGLPIKGRIVGIVARLQRWKGIHIFVEAASIVAKKHPDVSFVIVGGSHQSELNYPDELTRQAFALGVSNKIHFAGYQTNVSSWIHSVDILVHCTVGVEPFGMVIIEGMALGKAVIAARAGGPLEIVTHNEDGLLVPPEDTTDLSLAILKLIEDHDYYTKVCNAGINRAQEFSTERLSKDMAEFLESLQIGA